MSGLPGLPQPQRVVLPVPPDGADRARAAGRLRRVRTASLAVVVLLGVAGAGLLQRPAEERTDQLGPADQVPADRLAGEVVDQEGNPLPRIAVLPADLSEVLTRADSMGRFEVPCTAELLLAPYAPSTRDGRTRERSPGAADVAWRRVDTVGSCGERVRIVLGPGGAVEGRVTADRPARDVRLLRVQGAGPEVLPEGPAFATRVRADGSWRIEGLDTGRYLVEGTDRLVDVRAGDVTRLAEPLAG
jgi:hypothetical protein